MNRLFKITKPFPADDGTLVDPFLNSKDSESGLSFDLLDGFSIAAGTIAPRTRSKIHVMPFVTQVTFVRQGAITVRMKGRLDSVPYPISVKTNEAIITEAGTLFQLENELDVSCEVLYIVSPAYLYEKSGETLVYDDSVVLEHEWDKLESVGWSLGRELPTKEQRLEAERRLAARSRPGR